MVYTDHHMAYISQVLVLTHSNIVKEMKKKKITKK